MNKFLLVFFSALLSFQSFPASAAQSKVQVGALFAATFENKIRFNGQDCIKVKFKYKAAEGLNYPHQLMILGLYKLNGRDAGGFLEFKIGVKSVVGIGGEPNTGTKSMVLCQTARTELKDPDCDEEYLQTFDQTCDYEDIPGVKPGKYFFQATFLQISPTLLKESSKVFVTIGK